MPSVSDLPGPRGFGGQRRLSMWNTQPCTRSPRRPLPAEIAVPPLPDSPKGPVWSCPGSAIPLRAVSPASSPRPTPPPGSLAPLWLSLHPCLAGLSPGVSRISPTTGPLWSPPPRPHRSSLPATPSPPQGIRLGDPCTGTQVPPSPPLQPPPPPLPVCTPFLPGQARLPLHAQGRPCPDHPNPRHPTPGCIPHPSHPRGSSTTASKASRAGQPLHRLFPLPSMPRPPRGYHPLQAPRLLQPRLLVPSFP